MAKPGEQDQKGVVKVKGTVKKTFFSDKERQIIFFALSQLPSPEVIKAALINFDERQISTE